MGRTAVANEQRDYRMRRDGRSRTLVFTRMRLLPVSTGVLQDAAIAEASFTTPPAVTGKADAPSQVTQTCFGHEAKEPDRSYTRAKDKNLHELNETSVEMLHVIGIGIGPFNLSLAALIAPTPLHRTFPGEARRTFLAFRPCTAEQSPASVAAQRLRDPSRSN